MEKIVSVLSGLVSWALLAHLSYEVGITWGVWVAGILFCLSVFILMVYGISKLH